MQGHFFEGSPTGENDFGKCSLSDAVNSFMGTDAGIAFMGERIQQPTPQHFSSGLKH